MNPAKEDEMDHLDLLALLGMRFRVAPAGCGYGYEAVRMCPFCKKGHLSQHELIEVPQEVFTELRTADSEQKRREMLRTHNLKYAGKKIWVPLVNTEIPTDDHAIVVPYGTWNEYIQKKLQGG